MKKFLSIIIPRYKETEKEVFPLLSSISNQIGVDFSEVEVIISTDGEGGELLDQSLLSLFDIDIIQTINTGKNSGPGVTRQNGLNIAKGEYVMFCDADDILYSVGVLEALINETSKVAPDYMSTPWVEELVDDKGDNIYVNHEIDNTWMHGKIFRRNYLIQNGIKFHNDLRIHEDSYFLALAQSFSDRSRYLPMKSYVWRFKEDSITRRNNGIYTFDSMPEFIRACTMAHEEIEKRCPEQIEYKTIQLIIYVYFNCQLSIWKSDNVKEYLIKTEEALVKYIKPVFHYYTNATKELINKIYNEERERTFKNNVESELIDNWLKRIGLLKD